VGPFKYGLDSNNKFMVELQQVQNQIMDLVLEEPQNMRFKLYNLSANNMNIKLDIKEAE